MTSTISSNGPVSIRSTSSNLTPANRWDHFQARWGIRRGTHRTQPGLYALGSPTPASLVFVTANYNLSFDALRSALAGMDAYILVLDTDGINVWCAAGKGTFGTEEIVRRVEACRLVEVVRQRVLILPQLGAPGVAAHEVRNRTGFKVEYGPIRAEDLPAYLKTRKATAEMRAVRFNLKDRLQVTPVELVHVLLPVLLAAGVMGFLAGWLPALATAAALLAGAGLFPILLPWLPSRDFFVKGLVLGAAVVLPFSLGLVFGFPGQGLLGKILLALGLFLALPPVTAFLALNFTGSTTFTSPSGVRKEIFTYIRVFAIVFGVGVLVTLVTSLLRLFGRLP